MAWRDALQATPLSGDDPRRLFLAIAGASHENDAHLSRLLAALDGMPLAIELLAHAAEAEPDLQSVWRRWQTERSEMLKRGKGDQRLLSLAVSLELSIAGPRMSDPARRLLALLGLLPNGIARGDVNTLLPGCGHAAVATLRHAALAFDEAGRIRCLAPIREYIAASYPPSRADYMNLLDYQLSMHRDVDNILRRAQHSKSVDEMDLALASVRRVTGNTVKAILHALPTVHAASNADSEALLFLHLARMSRMLGKYDDAQDCANKALSLYRQMGNAHGEADSIKELDAIASKSS